MNTNLNFTGIVFLFFMSVFFISCEDDGSDAKISGKLYETTEDVLSGDSVYMTVEFDGGTPPFAFRYYFMGINPATGVYGKQIRYVLGINERKYTFGLLPTDTITYIAESVASYYNNVGPATGAVTFNVIPVDYVYEESIDATKTGYIQKSVNKLNFSTGQLQLKTDATDFARIVYFEFDANDFKNIQDKSRYILRFWIVSSHTSGVNKSAVMEVSGILGSLNDDMTWDTQPVETDWTPLFSRNFKTTSTEQQMEFTGSINPIVYKALESTGSKKFTIRVKENINGTGSGGMWYIGGNLLDDSFPGEAKKPSIDSELRKPRTD